MATHVVIRTAFNNIATGVQHTIEGTDIGEKVGELKQKAAGLVGLDVDEVEMVYCGRVMKDMFPLRTYGVKNGSTIMVTKKAPVIESVHESKFDAAALQKLSFAIRIRHMRNFQQALEKTLDTEGTVDKIIDGNRSLARDPIAIALLQDADLLMLTLNDSTARLRVLEAHPSLGEAVIELMKLVTAEMGRSPGSPATSRRHYNMDRMDSEEEEEMEVNSNQPFHINPASGGGLITADFFRQAMMAATGAGPDGAVLGEAVPGGMPLAGPVGITPTQPVVTEAQLQQLRDMGIMDDALARRALEVSNGDIQAALEYIFGDDEL